MRDVSYQSIGAQAPGLTEFNNMLRRFAASIAQSHIGLEETIFFNQSGAAIQWRATFPGPFATVILDGQAVEARIQRNAAGEPESSIVVDVAAGGRGRFARARVDEGVT